MANKCKRGILISKTPYEKRIAKMFGEADYETASQSWLWLTEKVRAIADSIVERKQAAIRNSAGAPPTHLS